jgi:thioredoxin reductase/ferredoxin
MLTRYYEWLHGRWPAGQPERLPVVNDDGSTQVPGLFVVGDIKGLPLLKFALDSGARAAARVAKELGGAGNHDEDTLDLAILGGGVAGMAAAVEAKKRGLRFEIIEAAEPFSTIVNFPKGKPIFTYPTGMEAAGEVQVSASVKEELLAELRTQVEAAGLATRRGHAVAARRRGEGFEVELADGQSLRARRVIVALGRSGNFRKLEIPGEDLDKVTNRLHDPADFTGRRCLIVGGGDSAVEAALALHEAGAEVTLAYRGEGLSRPKPENRERLEAAASRDPDGLQVLLSTQPREIREESVLLAGPDGERELPNDAVLAMIGREPPLDFFRRSGVPIRGEWTPGRVASLVGVLAIATFIYQWKKGGTFLPLNELFAERGWFPFNLPEAWAGLGESFARPAHLLGTLKVSVGEPGFWYSLAYCAAIVIFGYRRIKRRKTPYVTAQTLTLTAVQLLPLFLLPYLLLPWAGNNGWFDSGWLAGVADELFPRAGYGHGREYWRSFGFILAWPLFFWNVFTHQPMWGWLVISFVQTFVLIPLAVHRWGKGAYCGWICSCGALAETVGDTQREKMPHGPGWNRLNMVGQVFLVLAMFLLVTRALGWAFPGSIFESAYAAVFQGLPAFNYVWFVDLFWAGILGVGLYWHFSGRVWCRFACPLAALMHVYARFSQFAIVAEKKKCISCNACTTVCHQGIDVMNFANKGQAMQDPECVRCSACVQTCPTGVLQFGRVDSEGVAVSLDSLAASAVRARELSSEG